VLIASAVAHREFDLQRAAAAGLSTLFVLTEISHFIQTALLSQMLPSWVLARVPLNRTA